MKMLHSINEKEKRISIYKILLLLLVAVQIVYTVYVFTYVKKGTHTDETFSYGLANAYYEYVIAYDYKNYERWLPGKVMWDYLTVQDGEQFTYDSVYHNSTQDMHPFLYDMVVHTVCSFFPEKFSWWYGFSLNLIFLIVTQIFLFKVTKKVTDSEAAALLVCLFYGGGKGALLNFTFVRPYAMLTMLCVMYVYFSACYFDNLKKNNKLEWKCLLAAAVTANLSFMTHYYGIAFAGIFTALFCVYLLCTKRIKSLLAYGLSMSAALGLALIFYPKAVSTVSSFNESGGMMGGRTAFSPAVQIRILLSYMFEYNYGFVTSWYPTAFWNIALPLVGAAIVGALMLAFPFRHEEKFWKFIRKIKENCCALLNCLKNANYIPMFVAGSCFVLFEVISHSVEVWLMGPFVMRYISYMIPLIAFVAGCATWAVLKRVIKKPMAAEGIVFMLVCIALVRVHLTTGYPYRFPIYGETKDVLKETEGKNVLVVGMKPGTFSSEFASYMPMLYNADAVCFTSYYTLKDFAESGRYEDRKIDYIFINMQVYQLNEAERQKLDEKLIADPDIAVVKQNISEDAENEESVKASDDQAEDDGMTVVMEEEELDCRNQVEKLTGGAEYEPSGIYSGQQASYYILKLVK